MSKSPISCPLLIAKVRIDNSASSEALRKKIADSERMRAVSEAKLVVVEAEMQSVRDEAALVEDLHERMKDPLAAAEECLSVRRHRPLKEQTRDAVERGPPPPLPP
jgi:hypothetical protein